MTLASALFVGLVAVWAWSRLRPDPIALADRAADTGDLAPLLHALHRAGPTDYHRVLKRLWNGYHRDVAAQVARDYAQRHADAPTAQYWLRQVLENEPAVAAKHLDEPFLEAFYVPSVAQTCGSYG